MENYILRLTPPSFKNGFFALAHLKSKWLILMKGKQEASPTYFQWVTEIMRLHIWRKLSVLWVVQQVHFIRHGNHLSHICITKTVNTSLIDCFFNQITIKIGYTVDNSHKLHLVSILLIIIICDIFTYHFVSSLKITVGLFCTACGRRCENGQYACFCIFDLHSTLIMLLMKRQT